MRRWMWLSWAAALCGAMAACAAGREATTGPGGDGGTGGSSDGGTGATTSAASGGAGAGGAGGTGGMDLTVSSGTGGMAPDDGCDEWLKGAIYMLGWDKQFARFEPATSVVTVLGTVDCPGQEGAYTAHSMAVDRNGVAWMVFSDGNLYNLDTKTLVCTPTGFVPCQSDFCTFGMGFVADAPGSTAETLYVSDYGMGAKGLAKLDTQTLVLTPIADYDLLPGQWAELTGTGDARMFGYFLSPLRIAEIDRTTAKILSIDNVPSAQLGSWAFAFWGGVFYTMNGPSIRKFDPVTKTVTIINNNVLFDIVGAGVSTCAPVEVPK